MLDGVAAGIDKTRSVSTIGHLRPTNVNPLSRATMLRSMILRGKIRRTPRRSQSQAHNAANSDALHLAFSTRLVIGEP